VKHLAASRVLLFYYPSGCKRGVHFECYREAWYLMAPGGGRDSTIPDTASGACHGVPAE